ncbi:hypothetical protein DIS24_g8676 [Lasiodiplodia hormozganensis]|uniref:non-specific serine/threonine protein kinase n=1 Tax=Lasiodiplodia hormozganensis TaxID=869390 RepID=A0AA39XYU9_9PEZI|nr:hypothetical protein DIS24_g8676 [Lasiodiplodia hormozganensis]
MKLSQMYPDPPSPTEELGDYEGIVHELIWERCPEFVPRIFNYGCHDYDLNYRVKRRMEYLELEWMPHGDVWELMKHYIDHDKILPEPFIWYVFFALAKVAVYCLNGQLSDTKDPEWDRICHLDIKPDNIFLGAPNPNEPMEWARAYPVPKIGDWEMAYITTALYQGDPDDPLEWPRNPQDLQGTGTVGHMPPELLPRDLEEIYRMQEETNAFGWPEATLDRINELMPCDPTQQPFPPPDAKCGIDSWTTVWQIGMVIWIMLSGNNTPDDLVVDFSDSVNRTGDYPTREFRMKGPLRPVYSGRLVELTYSCLHADPEERIDVWDLFREVRDACQDVGRELKKKRGKDRDGLLVDGPVPVSVPPDKYPVAAAVLNDTPPIPLRPE